MSFTPGEFQDLNEQARAYLARAQKARLEAAMTQFHINKADEFCDVVQRRTGVWARDWKPRTVDPEVVSLTNMISNKMEEAGETVMIRSGLPLFMASAESFLVSREARKALRFGIDEWRNVVFLPAVGARRRSKMGTALDYFLWKMENENSHRPAGHEWRARMWVATHGKRVKVGGIREAVKELNRRISLCNREMRKRKKWDVEIVFRNIELGDLVDVNGQPITEDGEQTYHVHAHLLIVLKKVYSKEDWKELLAWVRKRLCPEGIGKGKADDVRWWKEAGEIVNTKELLKYILKPHNLSVLSGQELVKLFQQLFKLHICQPLGSFRELIKDLKGFSLIRPSENFPEWEITRNFNRRKPDEMDLDGTGVSIDELETLPDYEDEETFDGLDDVEKYEVEEHAPRVLAWKPPQPITSAVAFPHLLIRCADDEIDDYLDALAEKPEVRELIEAMKNGMARNSHLGNPHETVSFNGKTFTKAELDKQFAEEAKAFSSAERRRMAEKEAARRFAEQGGCYPRQVGDNWSGEPPPPTSPTPETERPPDIPQEIPPDPELSNQD